jgi:cytochrome c oxidase assembly protein subunit 15
VTALIRVSLLLVIILVSLSAFLRLSHSGIGCADWPSCYGRIGVASGLHEPESDGEHQPDSARSAYQNLINESEKPMSWATPAHRLVASVLGLLVIGINALAFRRRQMRLVSVALLALTVWLALLGIRSGSLQDPAVVMGNLSGGFAMLGLLGWMAFGGPGAKQQDAGQVPGRTVRGWVFAALMVLCIQIFLGGLTSANFAATACQSFPDCHGSWWPGSALATALDLSTAHEVTAEGMAIGGDERLAINMAHRLGAAATVLLVVLTGALVLRKSGGAHRLRSTAFMAIALVLAEFGLGVASVVTGLPIALALGHNALAALLLLVLVRMLALQSGADQRQGVLPESPG